MDHELDVQELIGQVMDLLSSVTQQYCINMDFKFNNEQVRLVIGYRLSVIGYWTEYRPDTRNGADASH